MTDADTDALTRVAAAALDRAREIITGSAVSGERDKSDRDPVTAIDLAVERALRNELRAAAPEVGFLGEESGGTGGTGDGRYWVLDPVDGTVNLSHGLPLCAVSLGLVDAGRAVLAAVDLPFLDLRYTAALGAGAYRNGVPLTAPTADRLRASVVALGDFAIGPDAEPRNVARLELAGRLVGRAQRVRMLGSAAIDLAWVADGRVGASVMLSNKPWEGAVGALLVREAGAVVVDVEGRPHTLESTSTVAAAPGLVDELLRALHQ